MIIKEEEKRKDESEKKNLEKLKERDIYLYQYDRIYKEKEPIDIKELIPKSTKNNTSRALIFGTAGVGKTTLCKYIAYNWAIGNLFNEFELVIYLPLRDWEDKTVKENIESFYPFISEFDIEVDINDILSRKTLFIFDGYDELKEEYKRNFRKSLEIVKDYIITSRPYGYSKGEFSINESFENIGFKDEEVEEYIKKYFKNEIEKANRLKEALKNNINIYQIAHIPLMLELICYTFKDVGKEVDVSSLTMTELYKNVVDIIFKGHIGKRKEIKEIKRIDRKNIQKLLGKLAFEGLKRQRIIFDGDFVEEILTDKEIKYLQDKVIISGFLKSDREWVDLLDNNLEFIHLTFQEYLSAYYVSQLEKEEIKEIVRKYKFYSHMQVFFTFLSGLIEDKVFLVEEIRLEPKDILRFYEINLLMNVFSQIKENEIRKDLLNEFFKDLSNWLRFATYREIQYELLLNNLKLINHLFRNDNLFVNKLIDVIKNENIDSWVRRNLAKALAKHTKERCDVLKVSKNHFFEEFAENSYPEGVLKAFKENIVDLNFVFLHGIYKILPFYLKNEVLCTVFEGEEISSRKVSQEEIKTALEKLKIN